jgi:thymidylate synthase ThyX
VEEKSSKNRKFNGPEYLTATFGLKVSVHLAKQFERRRFLKISQSETRIACGGHVC